MHAVILVLLKISFMLVYSATKNLNLGLLKHLLNLYWSYVDDVHAEY